MRTQLFSVEDIASVVAEVGLDRLMDETIEGLRQACATFDSDRYHTPSRDGFSYGGASPGLIEWMPALETRRHATIKMVGYHPTNPSARGLPTILSVALQFDTDSGHLAAFMDSTFATALRTGAASALASRILARESSKVLGLVGCGAQAVTQLHALTRQFSLERVLVFDTDPAASASLAERVAPLGLDDLIEPAELSAIARASDIICTATSTPIGAPPVIGDEHWQSHIHINAVGSDFPGKVELPKRLLQHAFVCPDFRAQAIKEGECQQLQTDEIDVDLVDLVKHADNHQAQRNRPSVFDSTGWALEDHVVVELLADYARQLGCGTAVELESIAGDPADPYAFAHERRPAPRAAFAKVRAVD